MLAQARSWWRALTGQSRLAGEMASEMDSHMERYAADLIARGVGADEAHRRARIEFGSTAAAAEECREAVGMHWPDEIRRDLRYAARVLRKSPTFTAAAVATLALCIGANTAIFSVVDAVLLRPLPYPQPDRLATVARHYKDKGSEGDQMGENGPHLGSRARPCHYVDAAVYGGFMGVNFAADGRVEYVRQQRVSAGFFRVLGIAPLIGREFSVYEDQPGARPVTVLSYALWKRVFREDASVVGQSVTLRGEPYTIVGVLPVEFPKQHRGRPLHAAAGHPHRRGRRLELRRSWPVCAGVEDQADAQVEAGGARHFCARDGRIDPGTSAFDLLPARPDG